MAILQAIDKAAPGVDSSARRIQQAESREELTLVLEGANYIRVHDTGEVMSRRQSQTVSETIGLHSRDAQRESGTSGRPILGEKSIGASRQCARV